MKGERIMKTDEFEDIDSLEITGYSYNFEIATWDNIDGSTDRGRVAVDITTISNDEPPESIFGSDHSKLVETFIRDVVHTMEHEDIMNIVDSLYSYIDTSAKVVSWWHRVSESDIPGLDEYKLYGAFTLYEVFGPEVEECINERKKYSLSCEQDSSEVM